MPTCVFAGCGPLSGPSDHGYLSVTGQLLGYTATTFCDTGFEVTGSKNRTCLESGWSGSPADCARVSCPALSNPQFGSMSTPKGTESEDEAIYECNEGFEMVGNSRRCCQSTGSWSDTAPTCKQIVTCPALLAPSNGTVSVSGPRQIGSTALYTCTYGLNTGNLERSCLGDGSWSGSHPTCSQACPSLSPPLNGDLSVTGLSIDDKATISCDVGYVIAGPTERSCTSSGWDGSAADCVPVSCPALSNPQFGSMSTTKETEFEDEAIYECNEGFEMVGHSRRRCRSTGSWSGTAPTCKQIVTCPALLAPSNGTVSVSGPRQIGSTALYTCTYGLNTGNLERSCLRDGSWSGSQPTCSQACPSLSPPLNGDLSVTGLSIDAKAIVSCDVGYVIAGPTERSCTSSGWDGSAADCVPVSCSSLSNPQYGSVSTPKWSEFEDEAIYECKQGFELVGNSRRWCQRTGSWSGTAPICKQIVQCSALMDPDDGEVDVSGPQPIGSTATFSCEFGLVSGSLVRYCLAGGIWSGMDPICKAACPSLSPPLNGDLIVTGLRVGHLATVTCDVGFVITGSAVRSCTSSGWDGSAADCAPIACPKLSNPCEGSVSTPNGTEFEDEAIYECKQGFELVGNSRRYCRSTGSWSGTAPTCKQIACPTLSNPRDGSVSTPYGTEIREEAIYECKQGFELVGNSQRYCRSTGSWSGTAPTCKQKAHFVSNLVGNHEYRFSRNDSIKGCGTLTAPSHGDISYTGRQPGDNAAIICDQGYTLTGPGARTCLVGGWDGASGDCVRVSCPVLSSPLDGSVTQLVSPVFEDVVSYSCDPGYALDGTNSRSCLSTGAWNGNKPTCVFAGCGTLTAPMHGDISYTGRQTGDNADIICDQGYTLTGPGARTCFVGGWDGASGDCVRVSCPVLSSPSDGYVTQLASPVFEDVVSYSCDLGYALNGTNSRYCLSTGAWSGDDPTCDFAGCGTLTAPAHGDISYTGRQPGDNAKIICDQGYTLTGPGARTCLVGGWNGASGDCVRISCPVLSSPSDGSVTQLASPVFEDVVTYSCEAGYALDSTNSRFCLSTGVWSGDDPTCLFAGCGTLTAPTHGDISYSGRQPSDIATIICDQGYTLTGPGARTCLVGGWDGASGDCVRISCPALSSPSNGYVTQLASPVFEDVVSYSCEPGYALDGTNSRSCLSTGAWSGDDPTCNFAGFPGNCIDVYDSISTSSGVYTVYPLGYATCPVSLYCDMTTDGGPWTVIQRRVDNSIDFNRVWADYRDGFGDPSANIWLGNENIHAITYQGSYELRVDLEDFEGNTAFAEYSSFSVGPESDKYRLSVSGYQSGSTAGDSLTYLNNRQFSTQDSDNDAHPTENCANYFKGGWWFGSCGATNLNGLFLGGAHSKYGQGVMWYSWKGFQYSVKSVMMIREII